MSFEFLAPDAPAGEAEAPRPRSPIEWSHRKAGAELGELGGWSVVEGFGSDAAEAAAVRAGVGVADLSFLGKLELQGDPGRVAAIVAAEAGGAELRPGAAALHEGVWWCPLGAERAMAVSPPERTAGLRERLAEAASADEPFVSVTELTAALASNVVAGPLAREAFARATALDMRPEHFAEGAFAPVSVARTAGMVLRERGDRFLHLFGSGYAAYVWTVFVDAAEGLGGRAVGLRALVGTEAGGA
ncbi:MAG: hypothetical protein U0R52_02930 [Solirubrobacterales bacterium]